MNNKTQLNTIIKNHTKHLKSYAIKLTGSTHKAEDLCQNTFIKFISAYKRKTFLYNSEEETAVYLRYIMYNQFLTDYRNKKKKENINNPIDPNNPLIKHPRTNNTVWQSFHHNDINRMLERIPSCHKSVLIMKGKGYKDAEIAEKLNIPIGTVKSRISRGRKILSQKNKPNNIV